MPLDFLQVTLELTADILAERDQFRMLLLTFENRFDERGIVRVTQPGLYEFSSGFCLKQRLDRPIVEPHDLKHLSNRAYGK